MTRGCQATNDAGIVQGAATQRGRACVPRCFTARTAPAITRLLGSTRPEQAQQKDRSGPKNALYLHSQYLLQLPGRPLLQQTHAHAHTKAKHVALLHCKCSWDTQLLARDAFPASVNRQQQLWPQHRPARAAVQRRATTPKSLLQTHHKLLLNCQHMQPLTKLPTASSGGQAAPERCCCRGAA